MRTSDAFLSLVVVFHISKVNSCLFSCRPFDVISEYSVAWSISFRLAFRFAEVRLQSQTSNAVRNDVDQTSGRPTNSPSSANASRHNRARAPVHYYTGTLDTFRKIVRAEGFRVLWSGLTPALLVSIPTVVIYFTSYMKAKQMLGYDERSPNPLLPVIAGTSRVDA